MRYAKDLIILHDGQMAQGKVEDKEFTVKTSFAKIVLKKNKIVHMHFLHPDGTGYPVTDEIKTNNGDDLFGVITSPKPITFTFATNGQTVKIKRDVINTIMFLGSVDHDSKVYPQFP